MVEETELPAFDPPVVEHDRAPVAWPDCTLPGTWEAFTATSDDGVELAGQIDLPEAGPTGKIVIFDPGTGGSDREMTIGGIARWACLAKPLLEAGVAVVRYDTRGWGLSGGVWTDVTLRDREDDLYAVAAAIAGRADLSGAGLYLLGHSEGGEHISAIGPRIPELDGLIVFAGVGTTGAEVWRAQLELLLENYGFDEDYAAEMLESREALIQQLLDGSYPYPTLGWYPREFWEEFVAFDGSALMAENSVPVGIFQGEQDWQVPPENSDLLAAAATDAGVEVTQVWCPSCGHFLNPAPTDFPSTGDEYYLPIGWDEAVAVGLVDWLASR